MPAKKAARKAAARGKAAPRKAAAGKAGRPARKAAPKRTVRVTAGAPKPQKIVPFLWFDGKAEEAARLYTSIFPDSRIDSISHYGEGAPVAAGSVMSVNFRLAGQQFIALNGGPMFQFTPAVSFFVHCASQAEIDRYWGRLLEGGRAQQCGWLQDRFGLSWQVVPTELGALLQDKDPRKAARTMHAMLQMVKLDIAKLRAAHAG